ncbi:TetR/AcrR family transcriptional regulator [Nocardioides marmoribigeumensis]|uniref:AcrR family transcriptional regulator n=1 Tax=Nocardioides marmoribigeumensis TaxID=433649 RepID=A0ABU2BSU3_9ACTN|nr:TetR/AcrR family transcriptional regulator [Nocardioides marmoribigeumensis]MDR7361064.1 AcrR family transcriptional regulator [Nocardioides marmoribigeumensis]
MAEASAEGPRERLLARAVEHFGRTGLGDRSLRGIAEDLGTSHRMLIYHFGSREGLVAAVSLAVEARQREVMAQAYADPDADPLTAAAAYWADTVAATRRYGPLFFEAAAHAAQGRPHADDFARGMVADWLPAVTEQCRRAGIPDDGAEDHARLALAATRGLLLDLLVTGEDDAVARASAVLHRFLLRPA